MADVNKSACEKLTCLSAFCHVKKNRILVLYSEQSLGLTPCKRRFVIREKEPIRVNDLNI
jgi:hypothetical protein